MTRATCKQTFSLGAHDSQGLSHDCHEEHGVVLEQWLRLYIPSASMGGGGKALTDNSVDFETSEITPNDTPLPISPCLLIRPRQFHQLLTKHARVFRFRSLQTTIAADVHL